MTRRPSAAPSHRGSPTAPDRRPGRAGLRLGSDRAASGRRDRRRRGRSRASPSPLDADLPPHRRQPLGGGPDRGRRDRARPLLDRGAGGRRPGRPGGHGRHHAGHRMGHGRADPRRPPPWGRRTRSGEPGARRGRRGRPGPRCRARCGRPGRGVAPDARPGRRRRVGFLGRQVPPDRRPGPAPVGGHDCAALGLGRAGADQGHDAGGHRCEPGEPPR